MARGRSRPSLAKLPHRWSPSLPHRQSITRRQAGPVSGVTFMYCYTSGAIWPSIPLMPSNPGPPHFPHSSSPSLGAATMAHSERANLAKFPHCLETSGLLPSPHLPHHHMVAVTRSCKRNRLPYLHPGGVIGPNFLLLSPPLTSRVSLPPIPLIHLTAAARVSICSDGGWGSPLLAATLCMWLNWWNAATGMQVKWSLRCRPQKVAAASMTAWKIPVAVVHWPTGLWRAKVGGRQ